MFDAGTDTEAKLVSFFKIFCTKCESECDNDCLASVVMAHKTPKEKQFFERHIVNH